MDEPTTWADIALPLGVLALSTVLLVVVTWQAMATWRARSLLAREQEYREIAAGAVAAQDRTATELRDIRARLTALEDLLRQVD